MSLPGERGTRAQRKEMNAIISSKMKLELVSEIYGADEYEQQDFKDRLYEIFAQAIGSENFNHVSNRSDLMFMCRDLQHALDAIFHLYPATHKTQPSQSN